MNNTAYLTLQNGVVFKGKSFGASGEVTGEIVFTTGMTGYLETLTDPSYYGQIILQTFPLIGNYGVIPADFESETISAAAYIVKNPCQNPSNFRSEGELDTFLRERGIVALYDIDTRALTKIIRQNGVMNGKISAEPLQTDSPTFSDIKNYSVENAIAAVSCRKITKLSEGERKIALLDFGAKKGIAECLTKRNCRSYEVWTFPHNTSAAQILQLNPHGIMLSNGPGDPAEAANIPIINTVRELMESKIPCFGICLGHQLMAMSQGYKTRKLKFGHRGANQPVKDTSTGRVYITSQNHGYEVIAPHSWLNNVNDGTCEGLDYPNGSFSVQFHPEAKGGPLDTEFLFNKFLERVNNYAVK
ncbi:MAG: carbamoyl phosphate synthase small subunit [Oscillospiraceae bacterium]|nr:carbamoyl phosphate synthase small subunit [Oscillospiraceae bacterium]